VSGPSSSYRPMPTVAALTSPERLATLDELAAGCLAYLVDHQDEWRPALEVGGALVPVTLGWEMPS
jgi:hypothetical protein